MKIYKFGGASIQDASHIRNVGALLKKTGTNNVLLVVSALGKSTNKLEQILQSYLDGEEWLHLLSKLENDYKDIAIELLGTENLATEELELEFLKLKKLLDNNRAVDYHYLYDQVVCFGEIISTKLLCRYLLSVGLEIAWIDARDYVITNEQYRDAEVKWEATCKQIEALRDDKFYITQGFIGGNRYGATTTLGREGSDYTAAVFAYALDAEEVTIWKDVAGVLNADPRYFKKTKLLERMSFEEAIELAYYGATVIHPKTIQPLKSKNIPLYVRSFQNVAATGTCISSGQELVPRVACFILKRNQKLLTLSSKRFSFIVEKDISEIFSVLDELNLKVNLMQNSAISLTLCIDDSVGSFDQVAAQLSDSFAISIREQIQLYTVRHFTEEAITQVSEGKELILRQTKDNVVHLVTS